MIKLDCNISVISVDFISILSRLSLSVRKRISSHLSAAFLLFCSSQLFQWCKMLKVWVTNIFHTYSRGQLSCIIKHTMRNSMFSLSVSDMPLISACVRKLRIFSTMLHLQGAGSSALNKVILRWHFYLEESMMSLPFLRLTLGRETQSTVLSSDKRAAILQ